MKRKTLDKKPETGPCFTDEYVVVGADLSLKRPGFSKLYIKKKNDQIIIDHVDLMSVDNKNDRKKKHGQLLNEIMNSFESFIRNDSHFFFVREKAIMHQKIPSERDLSKVIGMMDWLVWDWTDDDWYEIYPSTIKKLIAGSGRADKQQVAAALSDYVGDLEYKNDDESDAVAVALAWLIQNKQIKGVVHGS